ncbi:hypothetical protein JCM8097_003978 [Rhodosporidiobolus ruineniae]
MNGTHGLIDLQKQDKERTAWQDHYPPALTMTYLTALRNRELKIRRTHQQRRLLESEGDVGDLVFYNILAPVVDVLEHLIHPDYQHSINIAIQHHASVYTAVHGTNKNGVVETKHIT